MGKARRSSYKIKCTGFSKNKNTVGGGNPPKEHCNAIHEQRLAIREQSQYKSEKLYGSSKCLKICKPLRPTYTFNIFVLFKYIQREL